MPLTLRLTKGTELTHQELDDNFTYLESIATGSSGADGYINTVSYSNGSLSFSGLGSAFSGSVDISSLNTDTRDYVSNVSYSNGVISFTGQGAAYASTVDISGVNTDSVDYVSNVALTGTDLVFTGTGSAFNSSVSLAAITGSVAVTSTNTSASPLVLNSAAGSSFGTIFLKEASTSGPIAEFNQSLLSINSSHTLGTLNFTQFTNSWGKIKVQATNTATKSVMSFFADGTTTPKLVIDGENNKVSLPTLSSGSVSDVVGFNSTTGELTYFPTGSLGGGGIALTDLSVVTTAASISGSLSYNNTTGVFTYSPVSHQSYALLTVNGSSTGSISPSNAEDILYFKGGSNVTITAGNSSGTGDFSALTLDTLTFDVDLSSVSGSTSSEVGHTYLQAVGSEGSTDYIASFNEGGEPILWNGVDNNSPSASFQFGNTSNISLVSATSLGTVSINTATFIRVSISAFLEVIQTANNETITYAFQTSPAGQNNWTTQKTVQRSKTAPGTFADSFWSIFKIAAGTDIRILIGALGATTVRLLAGTQLEIIELN